MADLATLRRRRAEAGLRLEAAERRHRGGVEAVAELLAGLSAFDHSMACHVGIGYFDGTEITQEWDQLVRPAMERLKTASPSPAATPVSEAGGEAITARYTNWRGETAERTFIPHRVFFGSNEWHPEPQVLIEATDCEKGALRTFAAAGFAIAKPAAVGDVREATPAMVVAAFKVLPPDAEMGVGEMERVLNAALGARSRPDLNVAALREADTLDRAADIVERLPWHNAETIARRMRAAAANHKATAHG